MRHLIAGFAGGWLAAQIFLAGMLALDVGGLGTLVGAAADPLLPLAMLSLSLGALIGAAASVTVFLQLQPPASEPARALTLARVRRGRRIDGP